MTRELSNPSSSATATRTVGRRFRASPSNRRMGIQAEAANEVIPENHQETTPPPLLQVTLIAIQSIWSSSSSASVSTSESVNNDYLTGFLHQLIRRSRTNHNTLKLALFYIHQARKPLRHHISTTTTTTTTTNHLALRDPILSGRKMFLAGLMIASKYLLDRNYSNRAWAKIAGLPIEEVNTNERVFLSLIDYRTHLDLDDFEVWSFRLQKLMNEKRIKSGTSPHLVNDHRSELDDRSSISRAPPTSTVSSLPSSHSSPHRSTITSSSSRRQSAASAISHPTPSLKHSSPTKPQPGSVRQPPSLDLHTPIRQQTLSSDARNGFATAPSRINPRSADEGFPPARSHQATSHLTTPIRQQTLPAALSKSILSTAPAHFKPATSTHRTSLCEPSTPALQSTTPVRRSTEPTRQITTPARRNSEFNTPIRQQHNQHPLLSHPDKPPTTHQLAQSCLRAEVTTPARRERMTPTPILSRPSLSAALSDMSIRPAVYATPALSNLGSSAVNPPILMSPSLRAYQQPALGGLSSSRRSEIMASSKSDVASAVGPPKRSAIALENITPADVVKAEQDLMEKVAQEKRLLARQQETRRPTPSSSSVSTQPSDHQHQQKLIDQQLAHERRMRDEEKKEHLRLLLAEKNRKQHYPLQPALELGQERWSRAGSIVSSLDRPRADHPSIPSNRRQTEPSHLPSFDHSYSRERDEHLGQVEESSDSEQSSSSDDQLSDGLGYQARTSGEMSFVQDRLYGRPSLEEAVIGNSDFRQPHLPQTRQPPLSMRTDSCYGKDDGQKGRDKYNGEGPSQAGLRKPLEPNRPPHDQEPLGGRSLLSSDSSGNQPSLTMSHYIDSAAHQHRSPASVHARLTSSGTRGMTTPSSSGMNGYSGYRRQPTYRGVTPPLMSARPLQSCGLQESHHQALSTTARASSSRQFVERRNDPLASSRPPPALHARQSSVCADDPVGFPHGPRHPTSRPAILSHHQNRSFSDHDIRSNPTSSLRTPSSSLITNTLTRPPSASASSSSSSSSSRQPLDFPYHPLHHNHHHHHLYPSYYGLNVNHVAARPVY
ncbi:hypothetical protein PGT21_034972 [Puccinia graminis f. sp. tritici]|uniref:Cyclin N-terminal domain-containing protein n=2 Tax=Puccinia graminis f. sp. tritici TaxID=56615 RepID=A0A5B0NUJ1_PUCGR|nr:hypothetical protein PGT21_034972 [Puccinia graminis f. sp. tritici]